MEQQGFQYGLHSVKRLTSYLNSSDTLGISNLDEEKIAIKRSYRIAFNYDSGVITITFYVDFFARAESSEPLKLFGTVVSCDFKLIGFEGILKKDDKGLVELPDDLLITLLSVTYSTTRGVLAVQTAGTEYSTQLLPLVGTSEFGEVLKKMADSNPANQAGHKDV
jgi:hypothetical protein